MEMISLPGIKALYFFRKAKILKERQKQLEALLSSTKYQELLGERLDDLLLFQLVLMDGSEGFDLKVFFVFGSCFY